MKLAWLVWDDQEAKERGELPTLWLRHPERYYTYVQIVYAEIESDE